MAVKKTQISIILLILVLSLGICSNASAQRKSTAALARLDPIHSGTAFGGLKPELQIYKERRKYQRALAKWKRKKRNAQLKFERKRRKARLKEEKRQRKEREKLAKEIRKEQEKERRNQEKIRKAREVREEGEIRDLEVDEEREIARAERGEVSEGTSLTERKRSRPKTQNRPTFWAKFWRAIVGPKT
jgi:Skp family chaperone for outer membrane proteins